MPGTFPRVVDLVTRRCFLACHGLGHRGAASTMLTIKWRPSPVLLLLFFSSSGDDNIVDGDCCEQDSQCLQVGTYLPVPAPVAPALLRAEYLCR